MTAPRSAAARVADLERKVARQEEQITALSEKLAAYGDAFAAIGRYAGVSLPVPRHLRPVPAIREES